MATMSVARADTAPSDGRGARVQSRAVRRVIGLAMCLLALVVAVAASIAVGVRSVPLADVWAVITGHGATVDPVDRAAIESLRLPRTIAGVIVGPALAVSGAVIQAVTRNPLADPGLLGVNAGAAFFVAIAVGVLGLSSPAAFVTFALIGALLAMVGVYLIGAAGGKGASPLRLILAGVALSGVLIGIVRAMRLANPRSFDTLQVWEAGTLSAGSNTDLAVIVALVLVGLIVAGVIAAALNQVALGDDLATALGINVGRTRAWSIVAVTLLAGAATALAGPIAFVGLMVPHVARWIVGPDQRWILAYSLLLGPVLVLSADVVGRVIARPGEVNVGIVTALLGAPVLILLVRRQRMSEV